MPAKLSRQRTPHRSRLAFTLIELLVVISIVAVLAGLLMPALAMVKRAAKGLECAGNMHQLSVALGTYATEWRGVFRCYNFVYGVSESPWTVLLLDSGYVEAESIKILSCPSWGRRFSTDTINFWLGYGLRTKPASSNTWLAYSIPSPKTWSASCEYFFRIGKAPKSAVYPLITDTYCTDPGFGEKFGQQFYAWYLGTNCGGLNAGMVHFRHSSRANTLFADGHVEGVNGQQMVGLITAEYANPTLNMWGADAEGRAFSLD